MRKDNLLTEEDVGEYDSELDENPTVEERLAKIARGIEKSNNQLEKVGRDFIVSISNLKLVLRNINYNFPNSSEIFDQDEATANFSRKTVHESYEISPEQERRIFQEKEEQENQIELL